MPSTIPLVILVLIVIVVIGTGVGVAETSGGPSNYACMSISRQSGSGVDLTTTGLIHYLNSQFYISCNEGSNLPTGQDKVGCLTIAPQNVAAKIGVGASTEYYYVSAGGNALTLQGAPAPTNGTEIVTPAGVSLQTPC
jgi:hypothetical protein